MVSELRAARVEGATTSEILFAVWVELGAVLFLRGEP
jgi:hypothetical protein